MSARLLVLYETPGDPETFDRHYRDVHVPLARKLPGLRSYTISNDLAPTRGGEPFYLVAELEWDSTAELLAAFASPEGRATAADATYLEGLADMRAVTFAVESIGP